MRRKIRRKLLSFLTALAMVIGLMPGMNMVVWAEGEHTKDVNLSSTWAVPSGTTSLCLNGYNIIQVEDAVVINCDGKGLIIIKNDNLGRKIFAFDRGLTE